MALPYVSVLLPVRNCAQSLGPALESLLAQSLEDFEIVAVDDGSDDGQTPEVLADYGRRDSRVRLIRQERAGVALALNRAVGLARGRYLARMDGDDLCHPDRLALQVDHLEAHAQVDVVSCLVRYGGNPALCPGYARHVDWLNTLTSHESMALGVFRDAPVAHPSVMMRAEAFTRFGLYRQGPFPEDYDLWLRWLSQGARLAKLPRQLFTWNDPPGRLSRTDPRYDAEAFYALKAEHLARWLARHNPFHPNIYMVGAGRVSRRRARPLLEQGVNVLAYLDIDPRKIGGTRQGRPVIGHEQCPGPEECFVVSYVSSPDAWKRIAVLLEAAGFVAGRNYVLAA